MTRPTPDQPDPTRLSPADADALDTALGELAVSADADRAERLAAVLSLLDRWHVQDPAPELVASLMDRLAALRNSAQTPVSLCADDARAFDALLACRAAGSATGNTTGPMPPGTADRAPAVTGIASLLDRWQPAEADATLADRTMQTIDRARRQTTFARRTQEQAPAPAGTRGWLIGLRQVGSAAALIVLSGSLLIPVLGKARTDAQVAECKANLANAGTGLAQYADDHDGALPHTRPEPVFSQLMRFAEDNDGSAVASSAVHMLVLPRDGYLRQEMLTCPTADTTLAQGGLYSAQAVAGSRALRLGSLDGPVMADTNPLYTRTAGVIIRQAGLDTTRSANHKQRGQNVLMTDGSVMWTLQPVVRHDDRDDNIWTRDAQPREDESPTGHDAFLTP